MVGLPIHNCCLWLFFLEKDCVYLDAERLYDHIKWETFQTRALTSPPHQARVKRARKRYCARSARSSNTRTKVPICAVACIISYQTAKETMCMQCPSYGRQLRHEVTKKAIKAALKLCACMQYVIYASHLRTCLWNGFKNCPEAPQHCLPHLTHPIQLVRSLVETLSPEVSEKVKRVVRK